MNLKKVFLGITVRNYESPVAFVLGHVMAGLQQVGVDCTEAWGIKDPAVTEGKLIAERDMAIDAIRSIERAVHCASFLADERMHLSLHEEGLPVHDLPVVFFERIPDKLVQERQEIVDGGKPFREWVLFVDLIGSERAEELRRLGILVEELDYNLPYVRKACEAAWESKCLRRGVVSATEKKKHGRREGDREDGG